MTALWEGVIEAAPVLRSWMASPASTIRAGRLPRAAWPIVAGAIARTVLATDRSLLILTSAPDRFADELRPWLAGRPPAYVFSEVAV